MDETEKIKKRTRSYIAASEEISRNLKKEIEKYVTNMFYADYKMISNTRIDW